MTTTIKNREYQVETLETGKATESNLIRRGWDGQIYILKGKKGACYMAYRNTKTGTFEIVR